MIEDGFCTETLRRGQNTISHTFVTHPSKVFARLKISQIPAVTCQFSRINLQFHYFQSFTFCQSDCNKIQLQPTSYTAMLGNSMQLQLAPTVCWDQSKWDTVIKNGNTVDCPHFHFVPEFQVVVQGIGVSGQRLSFFEVKYVWVEVILLKDETKMRTKLMVIKVSPPCSAKPCNIGGLQLQMIHV